MSHHTLAYVSQSHRAIAAKKKVKREQIKEVLFDEEARRDFLTGFHKRKMARNEAARERAKEREKQERLEARREQRRMLRERAKENAETVEKAYGALAVESDDDEWDGIDGDGEAQERDEEYENEETIATVTVVEDFDPETITRGPIPQQESLDRPVDPSAKKSQSKSSGSSIKKKPRDKKIRYQTKDARKSDRQKQRARRTEKAELAGGKASRKKSTGSRRKGGSKH